MARTNVVDSATSQFFINTGTNNGFLDHRTTPPWMAAQCSAK
jgi:cyclophilin family peptidyl-prolyl cis-trans isomerase